jgi:signal transduction histidine kinase
MPQWIAEIFEKSASFMPHGHCYLWLPSLLWLHVLSDLLIGVAYVGIALLLWLFVRRIRMPFSPVFIAFGLFIGLCGGTHFMQIWTVWNPDYVASGLLKAATAAASVATAIGVFLVRPQVEEVVHSARLSEERRIRLESTNAELELLFARLKEADEAKSRFFANVSHELRTPLALILGPAEEMLSDETLSDAQRRKLNSMSANGRSLLRQVNDLLDLARFEAGSMQLHYVSFDAAEWVRRVGSQFELAAERRRIMMRIDTPDRLEIEADVDKFERVLINLLSNALKFTPEGGDICVALDEDEAGEGLRLTVSDSGPGVPEGQRERVFERFRQVEDGDARRHGGSGLGLAIVKDFVALHRGEVSVTAAPQGGALFSVTVPRKAPADAVIAANVGRAGDDETSRTALAGALHELAREVTESARSSAAMVAGRATVLVVEDNAEMRNFVAATLEDACNVVTAADGHAGLQQARALQPDLIVTDLMMPGMTGDQLVQALRDSAEFEATPILLLTARDDDALRERLLQSGAQDYLTKPFRPQELRARAQNLLIAKRAGDTLRSELVSMSTDLEGLATTLAMRNRQLQTALEGAEVARLQAERASEVKSSFLGMISHELRTPLSTVHMNLQLLSRDRGGTATPESMRPRLDRLAQAAQQMSTLIEGLLQYTRVESGRIPIRVVPIDLADLAATLVEEHADTAPPTLKVSLAPAEPMPILHSDPALLRVVISNLIGNAVKFTREGIVTVYLRNADGAHIIEIRDTGIGIAEADFPRIFEPFEQLEPLRRKTIPGVGLGLSLVRQIVDALGGTIEVQSVVGNGSMFRVTLPGHDLANGVRT